MLIQITASRSGVRVLLEPRCDLTMNFRTLALAFCIAFPCLPVQQCNPVLKVAKLIFERGDLLVAESGFVGGEERSIGGMDPF